MTRRLFMNNKAFTLIELLVVVLIIGILASVALPKYKVAVAKARYTQLVSVLNAFRNAEEVYYLSNGSYVDDTDMLDIGEITGCTSGGAGGHITCDKFGVDVQAGSADNNPLAFNDISGYTHHQDYSPNDPGQRECWALSSSKVAHAVCKSLGGTFLKKKTGYFEFSGKEVTQYVLP